MQIPYKGKAPPTWFSPCACVYILGDTLKQKRFKMTTYTMVPADFKHETDRMDPNASTDKTKTCIFGKTQKNVTNATLISQRC